MGIIAPGRSNRIWSALVLVTAAAFLISILFGLPLEYTAPGLGLVLAYGAAISPSGTPLAHLEQAIANLGWKAAKQSAAKWFTAKHWFSRPAPGPPPSKLKLALSRVTAALVTRWWLLVAAFCFVAWSAAHGVHWLGLWPGASELSAFPLQAASQGLDSKLAPLHQSLHGFGSALGLHAAYYLFFLRPVARLADAQFWMPLLAFASLATTLALMLRRVARAEGFSPWLLGGLTLGAIGIPFWNFPLISGSIGMALAPLAAMLVFEGILDKRWGLACAGLACFLLCGEAAGMQAVALGFVLFFAPGKGRKIFGAWAIVTGAASLALYYVSVRPSFPLPGPLATGADARDALLYISFLFLPPLPFLVSAGRAGGKAAFLRTLAPLLVVLPLLGFVFFVGKDPLGFPYALSGGDFIVPLFASMLIGAHAVNAGPPPVLHAWFLPRFPRLVLASGFLWIFCGIASNPVRSLRQYLTDNGHGAASRAFVRTLHDLPQGAAVLSNRLSFLPHVAARPRLRWSLTPPVAQGAAQFEPDYLVVDDRALDDTGFLDPGLFTDAGEISRHGPFRLLKRGRVEDLSLRLEEHL